MGKKNRKKPQNCINKYGLLTWSLNKTRSIEDGCSLRRARDPSRGTWIKCQRFKGQCKHTIITLAVTTPAPVMCVCVGGQHCAGSRWREPPSGSWAESRLKGDIRRSSADERDDIWAATPLSLLLRIPRSPKLRAMFRMDAARHFKHAAVHRVY